MVSRAGVRFGAHGRLERYEEISRVVSPSKAATPTAYLLQELRQVTVTSSVASQVEGADQIDQAIAPFRRGPAAGPISVIRNRTVEKAASTPPMTALDGKIG